MRELTFIEQVATAGALAVLHVVLSLLLSLPLLFLMRILKVEFILIELQQLVLSWFLFFFSSLWKGLNMLKNCSFAIYITINFGCRRPLDS